jgi:NAD-dependent SIR2 family protein deacetylase
MVDRKLLIIGLETIKVINMEKKQTAVEWILNLFRLKCPECKKPMTKNFLDMEIDHLVHECHNCKKLWI